MRESDFIIHSRRQNESLSPAGGLVLFHSELILMFPRFIRVNLMNGGSSESYDNSLRLRECLESKTIANNLVIDDDE